MRTTGTTISVDDAQVRLNIVTLMRDTKLVKWWQIDCHTKYPSWIVGSTDEGFEVLLMADDRTLRPAETNVPTLIKIPLELRGVGSRTTSTRTRTKPKG